jgi:hypothetical protein
MQKNVLLSAFQLQVQTIVCLSGYFRPTDAQDGGLLQKRAGIVINPGIKAHT